MSLGSDAYARRFVTSDSQTPRPSRVSPVKAVEKVDFRQSNT